MSCKLATNQGSVLPYLFHYVAVILTFPLFVGCAHVAYKEAVCYRLGDAISVSGLTLKSPGSIQVMFKNVSDEAWILEVPDRIAFDFVSKDASPDHFVLYGGTRWDGFPRTYYVFAASAGEGVSDSSSLVLVSGQYFEDRKKLQDVNELQLMIYGLPVAQLPRTHNLKEWEAAFDASATLISGPLRDIRVTFHTSD